MKILKTFLYLFLPLCFFASCEDDLIDTIINGGNNETEEPDGVTYLLYMVGQNDLSYFLTDNINDLKKGLEQTDIEANILVYADINKEPELYLISKDETGTVTKKTVKTYPDQYSVDPEVMKEVINYVFTTYPAARRGITFSSHANGSLYTYKTVPKRSFGYEGSSGYGMNITDMREALDGCPKLDLIMFDACLMASIETAYELKDNTHYFMATPNSVPGEGFPYDKLLSYILKMDADGLSKAAEGYMDYFHGNSVDWDDFVAISVSDLTNMNDLATYMDVLFQDEEVQKRIVDRSQLQAFEVGYQLYDYGQWVDSIGKDCGALPKVKEYLDKVVVYKAHSDYSSVDDYTYNMLLPVKDETFCGLNTYVPPMGNNTSEILQQWFFTTLQWYRDAGFSRSAVYNLYADK